MRWPGLKAGTVLPGLCEDGGRCPVSPAVFVQSESRSPSTRRGADFRLTTAARSSELPGATALASPRRSCGAGSASGVSRAEAERLPHDPVLLPLVQCRVPLARARPPRAPDVLHPLDERRVRRRVLEAMANRAPGPHVRR